MALSDGSNWNDWKTKPSRRPRSTARASLVEPAEFLARQLHDAAARQIETAQPEQVDFPEPDAPTMATVSPPAIRNEFSCE